MPKKTFLLIMTSIAFSHFSFGIQPINIPNTETPSIPIMPLTHSTQNISIVEILNNKNIKTSLDQLSWNAEYEAVLSSDHRTIDLSGFITLSNESDKDFINRTIQVTAEPIAPPIDRINVTGCLDSRHSKKTYQIFELPEKIDLMSRQMQIIPFLSIVETPITKECRILNSFNQYGEEESINCYYHIDRDTLNLKSALPNGAFTLIDDKEQTIQQIEPSKVSQTYNLLSKQQNISLNLGNTSDIVIKKIVTNDKVFPDASYLSKHQIALTNPTHEDITIHYFWEDRGAFELTELSHPIVNDLPFYTRNKADNTNFLAWKILIPAKNDVTFSYIIKLK